MRPIFTVNAGEYLVSNFIEEKFRNYKVWIPSKDKGIDLLITNDKNNEIKTVSIQVKLSKDYAKTAGNKLLRKFKFSGWFMLDRKKIEKSISNFWVFVLLNFKSEKAFVIIEPEKLLEKLDKVNKTDRINIYLSVTNKNKCWNTRDLDSPILENILHNNYKNDARDFSDYLNNWENIIKILDN